MYGQSMEESLLIRYPTDNASPQQTMRQSYSSLLDCSLLLKTALAQQLFSSSPATCFTHSSAHTSATHHQQQRSFSTACFSVYSDKKGHEVISRFEILQTMSLRRRLLSMLLCCVYCVASIFCLQPGRNVGTR